MENRRVFSRVKFVTDVKIVASENAQNADVEKIHNGELLDISLKGALIKPPEGLTAEIGDKLDLSFLLSTSDVTLTFLCEIVHKQEDRFGVKFTSEDLATMTHLRRLVELNLGDHEKIEKELPFLIG